MRHKWLSFTFIIAIFTASFILHIFYLSQTHARFPNDDARLRRLSMCIYTVDRCDDLRSEKNESVYTVKGKNCSDTFALREDIFFTFLQIFFFSFLITTEIGMMKEMWMLISNRSEEQTVCKRKLHFFHHDRKQHSQMKPFCMNSIRCMNWLTFALCKDDERL